MPFPNAIKALLLSAFEKRGRRITRQPLMQYLRDFQIDCILDVGANTGQYALELRRLGFRQKIVSFEPIPEAIVKLKANAATDDQWFVHEYALGTENCRREINISANLASSSFLEFDSSFLSGNSDLRPIGTTSVEIRTLDSIFESTIGKCKKVFLKIDTQGFERQVIEGGLEALRKICFVQMELSLTANYEGETLIEEMFGMMREQGFTPWWIMDGFRDQRSLQMYQADVFFASEKT